MSETALPLQVHSTENKRFEALYAHFFRFGTIPVQFNGTNGHYHRCRFRRTE